MCWVELGVRKRHILVVYENASTGRETGRAHTSLVNFILTRREGTMTNRRTVPKHLVRHNGYKTQPNWDEEMNTNTIKDHTTRG